MPEKVELLYNDIKKDYEVGSLDDFKKYLDDPIKREKFYNEIVKPNYDVATLDEFENVYGLKKKEPTVPASTPQAVPFSTAKPFQEGGVTSFNELGVITDNAKKSESEAPSTSKKIDIFQPRFGDIQNKKDAIKATEAQDIENAKIDEATPIPTAIEGDMAFNRAARQTKVTRDFYNPAKNPEIKNLTKKEQEVALSQKLISEGVYTPEEVAMQNATIAEQKRAKELQIEELKKEKPTTLEEYDYSVNSTKNKTVYFEGRNYEHNPYYTVDGVDYAILPDKTKVKYQGDSWVRVTNAEADKVDKIEEGKQLEFFNKPQNISSNLFTEENEKQFIGDVDNYLYYLKENAPIEYLNLARKTLGNRGDASVSEHKINQDNLEIQQAKRKLIKDALEFNRKGATEDLSALVNRNGLDNFKAYLPLSKTLEDPNATPEQKANVTNLINSQFSPTQINDFKTIEELAKVDLDFVNKLKYADSKAIGPKAYTEEGKQLLTNWWATQHPIEASIRDIPNAIIGNLVNSAGSLAQVVKIADSDNKYGAIDAFSDQVEHLKKELSPRMAERTLIGEDGSIDATAIAPALANGLTTMATLAYGGGLIGGAGKALGVASGTAFGIGTVASSFILTHNDYYQQAIESNALTPAQANAFAIGASMLQSALELVSPGEKIWGESGVAKITLQEAMKRFAAGESFKSILKPLGKEVMSENLQEVMQLIGDKLVNGVTNTIVGKDALETGIKASELAETVGVTTLVTLLAGGVRGVQTRGDSRNEIIDKLSLNDKVLEISLNAIQANVSSGIITKEKGDEISQTLIDRNATFNEMPKEWNDNKKSYLAPEVTKLKEAQNIQYGVSPTGEIEEIQLSEAQKVALAQSEAKVKELSALSNDYFDTIALTEKQKVEELAKGNPAVVTTVLETPNLTPEQKAQEIINLENEAKKPIETTVGEVIDVPVMKDGKKGSIYQDGQTLVFKYSEGNREIELGNIDEIKERGLSEFGLKQEERVVSFNDNNQITVDEVPFVNNFSKPLQAINYDDNGNIISVNLNTEDGKNRTFKGQIAEDIAYQLHLQEISKDNVIQEEFLNHINTDENAQQEIINGGLQETTTENTVEVNAPVQPTESGTGEVKTTTEIKPVEKNITESQEPLTTKSNGQKENDQKGRKQEANVLETPVVENQKVGAEGEMTAPALLIDGKINTDTDVEEIVSELQQNKKDVSKENIIANIDENISEFRDVLSNPNITPQEEQKLNRLVNSLNKLRKKVEKGTEYKIGTETTKTKKENATKEREIPKNNKPEYKNGDGTRKATETSNSDSIEQSRKEPTKEKEVAPIRELGTGAKVYLETKNGKYRVNDSKDKVLLIVHSNNKEDNFPIATYEFSTPKEAVDVANELARIYPEGVPPAALIDKIVDGIKKELSGKKTTQEVIDEANYTPRRKTGVLVRLPIDLVLDNQEEDYKVTRGKNEIGNRIDKAKKFLEGSPTELEASDIHIKYSGKEKGKIGFSDGRHRLIAAKELGATHAYFEINGTKEQFDALFYLLSEFGNVKGIDNTELYSTQGDYKIIQTSDNTFLAQNGSEIYQVKLNESGGVENSTITKNGKNVKNANLLLAIQDHLQNVNPESNARNVNKFIGRDKNSPIPKLDKVSKKEQQKIDELIEEDTKPTVITNLKDFKKAIKKAIPSLTKKEIEVLAIQAETLKDFTVKEFGLSEEEAWRATQGEIVKSLEEVGVGSTFLMTVNGKQETVRSMPEVTNGFYSPLEKIVGETKFDKLPAKQWLDKFAKGEEAKWTGLSEWLKEKGNAPVSKNEIQTFLRDNRIQVVEVVKGGGNYDKDLLVHDVDDEDTVYFANFSTSYDITKNGDKFEVSNPWDGEVTSFESVNDVVEFIKTTDGEFSPGIGSEGIGEGNPKFTQYQLEGDKSNYREVLVTMPSKNNLSEKEYNELRRLDDKSYLDRTASEQYRLVELQTKFNKSRDDKGFSSSHFTEPNILVHLRMSDRIDADGNKVLHISEIQSDWGQQGKKGGFESTSFVVTYRTDNGLISEDFKTRKEAQELVDKVGRENVSSAGIREINKGNTPLSPFVTDTNSWVKLALKTALKEAVKSGAAKITWETGETQNDRYDLSKTVSKIKWNGDDKIGIVSAYGLDGNLISEEKTTVDKLPDLIGKDASEKLLQQPKRSEEGNAPMRILEGDGLKVGGKGMKGFYGSPSEKSLGIVGNVAKSLFKQEPKTTTIKGGKGSIDATSVDAIWVEDNGKILPENKREDYKFNDNEFVFTIDNNVAYRLYDKNDIKDAKNRDVYTIPRGNYFTQHSIDITPELRAEVEQGLPLFQEKNNKLNSNDTTNRVSPEAERGRKESGTVNKESAVIPSSIYDANRKNEGAKEELSQKEIGNSIFKMEGNTLNLQKIIEYAKSIITGEKIFKRFSQEEQRGFTEGGTANVEASIILSRNEGPSGQDNTTNEGQEDSIEQYAKEKGIWVDNTTSEFNRKYQNPIGAGQEAIVWGNPEKGTVVKTQNTFQYGDLQGKLDSITLHNSYFPETATKVIGFGRNEEGDFQIIVEQQFIQADKTKKVTPEQIKEYMNKLGFENTEKNDYANDKTLISDLHTGNVILDKDGNILVIDPIMGLNTPEQGYGGTRKLGGLNEQEQNGNIKGAANIETQQTFYGKQADISTAIHEPHHHFLGLIDTLASQGNAKAIAMQRTVNQWTESKEGKAFAEREGLEQNSPIHRQELFARSAEKYFTEGKRAGFSERMNKVFEAFKTYLKDIYDNVVKSPFKIELSPEIRDLFDTIYGKEKTNEDLGRDKAEIIEEKTGEEIEKKANELTAKSSDSLLKQQKENLLNDLNDIEDILLGEDGILEKNRISELDIPNDRKSDLISGLTNNIDFKEKKNELKKAGFIVVGDAVKVPIYKDGEVTVGNIRYAMQSVMEDFPTKTEVKISTYRKTTPSLVGMGKYDTLENSKQSLQTASDNLEQAKKDKNKGLIETYDKQLKIEKANYQSALSEYESKKREIKDTEENIKEGEFNSIYDIERLLNLPLLKQEVAAFEGKDISLEEPDYKLAKKELSKLIDNAEKELVDYTEKYRKKDGGLKSNIPLAIENSIRRQDDNIKQLQEKLDSVEQNSKPEPKVFLQPTNDETPEESLSIKEQKKRAREIKERLKSIKTESENILDDIRNFKLIRGEDVIVQGVETYAEKIGQPDSVEAWKKEFKQKMSLGAMMDMIGAYLSSGGNINELAKVLGDEKIPLTNRALIGSAIKGLTEMGAISKEKSDAIFVRFTKQLGTDVSEALNAFRGTDEAPSAVQQSLIYSALGKDFGSEVEALNKVLDEVNQGVVQENGDVKVLNNEELQISNEKVVALQNEIELLKNQLSEARQAVPETISSKRRKVAGDKLELIKSNLESKYGKGFFKELNDKIEKIAKKC